MTKQKPVWRMNTGVKPDDRLEDSPVLEVSGRLSDSGYNNFIWELDDKKCYPIAAYQTIRTKAAKFKRTWCKACDGYGFVKKRPNALEFVYEHKKCPDCQGRCYIWKMGERK